MDKSRPTKKQKELLSFIDGFIKGYGYAPSYREIMRALNYKSVSTVATHVNGLIARGWLIKKDNSARSLEVMYDDINPVQIGAGKKPAKLKSEVTWEQVVKWLEAETDEIDELSDRSILMQAADILNQKYIK